MASKIQLISNALILIGDLPVTSLEGNSRAQTVANNLYLLISYSLLRLIRKFHMAYTVTNCIAMQALPYLLITYTTLQNLHGLSTSVR
jgi:hypothetical protein